LPGGNDVLVGVVVEFEALSLDAVDECNDAFRDRAGLVFACSLTHQGDAFDDGPPHVYTFLVCTRVSGVHGFNRIEPLQQLGQGRVKNV